MSFTQPAYFVFLPITLFLFHLFYTNVRAQNWILLIASVVFYSWWDWRFLSWLAVSVAIAYCAGITLPHVRARKEILAGSICALLGILAYFKYANFFLDNFVTLLRSLGLSASATTLKVILPIGISFYTFQAIAYIVDVYRAEIAPERDIVRFATFKIFFPQLVAGPIERAAHLLPQIAKPARVDQATVAQALWITLLGYFLKIGIADVLAPYVELAFSKTQPSGWWTLLGTLAFGLQIYGDFLGYSLIARGVALLFGIELIWNFHFPYWATSIIDFWHRWHISLSRWLRDYLYIPLGGSRTSTLNTTRNLMVTMLLGGLWHGANWTFVIWGGLHGSALVLNHWLAPGAPSGRFQKALGWAITMLVVFVGWFIFRVASMQQAFAMVSALGNLTWFPAHTDLALTLASSTAAVAAIEFAQLRSADHCFVLKWHEWPRAALYAGIVGYLILVRQHAETKFIYFQF